MFNCYPTYIGSIVTNIIQNPSAKVVELSGMPIATREAEELDMGVFNGEVYLYHDQMWYPVKELWEDTI